MDNPRPIPESYWVETGRLLAGEYPGQYDQELTRKRVDALIEAGFDTFMDLTQDAETFPYAHILKEQAAAYDVPAAHYRFPIGDFGLPTPQLMNTLLDQIEESLESGHKIYLHCWGGIGRTGTTVGCYLIRKGMNADGSLERLSAWWRSVPKSQYHPYSPETRAQVDFIRTWAEHDHKLQRAGK